jgi:hypothetical protein
MSGRRSRTAQASSEALDRATLNFASVARAAGAATPDASWDELDTLVRSVAGHDPERLTVDDWFELAALVAAGAALAGAA